MGMFADAPLMERYLGMMFEPYDPDVNQPKDVGLGGLSTEYTASEIEPSGQAVNYPQIWWTPQGEPVLMEGDPAYNMMRRYEAMTSKQFPRFPNIGAAVWAAMNRSATGGGNR